MFECGIFNILFSDEDEDIGRFSNLHYCTFNINNYFNGKLNSNDIKIYACLLFNVFVLFIGEIITDVADLKTWFFNSNIKQYKANPLLTHLLFSSMGRFCLNVNAVNQLLYLQNIWLKVWPTTQKSKNRRPSYCQNVR